MVDSIALNRIINKCLDALSKKPGVRMYLVTKAKREDNPFTLYKLEPDSIVAGNLRDILSDHLSWINKYQEVKFRDFFSPHRNPSDILVIKSEHVEDFRIIRNIINQHPYLNPPPSIKNMARIWGYAIEIDAASGRTIYFRKFSPSKIIGRTEKGKWVGKVSEGRIMNIEEDLLTFDQYINCIYFETFDSILVARPHYEFETMFDFRIFYENEYDSVMEKLTEKPILEFDDDSVKLESKRKIRLIRKISELSLDGFFKKIEIGEISNYFFETTKLQVGGKITYEIDDNKIRIPTVDALGSFIDVCAEKYVKSIAGYKKGMDPRIFMAEYKEPLE